MFDALLGLCSPSHPLVLSLELAGSPLPWCTLVHSSTLTSVLHLCSRTPYVYHSKDTTVLQYMSPRPILKHHLDIPTPEPFEPFPFAACPSVLLTTRHVHFPPTPTLTSTFTTHSPSAYDRTPLSVSPNACALPGRHERELFVDNVPPPSHHRPSSTSHPSHSRRARAPSPKGGYFHPRAYEACAPELLPPAAWSTSVSSPGHSPPPPFPLPLLIFDNPHNLSPDSESSSSDSQVTTPSDDDPDPVSHHHAMSVRYATPSTTTAYPSARYTSSPVIPNPYLSSEESALSYLPDHYRQSPATKEWKAGRRSSDNSSSRNQRNPRQEVSDHHNFTYPSLDFGGCLGGF